MHRTDIPRLLQSMDVFILPSKLKVSLTPFWKRWPLDFRFIATRVGGNSELVVEGENWPACSSKDPETFGHLLAYLKTEGRCGIMGSQGGSGVEKNFQCRP